MTLLNPILIALLALPACPDYAAPVVRGTPLDSAVAFVNVTVCLLCLVGAHALSASGASAQPPPAVPVIVVLGVGADGAVTDAWVDAIRGWHDGEALGDVLREQHAMSDEEAGWAALIHSRAAAWSAMTDSLQSPFEAVVPPAPVYVILGNVGGPDAFTPSDSTMGFDLHRLSELYGVASASGNAGRIDRLFAHEFTHLMHKAWQEAHKPPITSPLDRALWDCLVEGLGNYRSLSGRWVEDGGALTVHAREALARLQPIFADRISALQHASDDEAAPLIEGLSSGPFDQKWGALTVALWLAQESRGDDRRLRRWVEAGPRGVLTLARMYLPPDLQGRVPDP